MPPETPLVIRPYQPTDADAVQAVLAATYAERATPRDRYHWWSLGCPVATTGFMVAVAGEKLVGVQPMAIFPYRTTDTRVTGAMLTGVAVHPQWRRRGIFSALLNACEHEAWRQGAAFITTMPNDQSRPGFLKMGYTDLGLRTLLLRPLKPAALGARLVPVLGWAAGAGAGLLQTRLKPTPPPAPAAFHFRDISTLTPLHIQAATQHHALFPGLGIDRSAPWLHWRYRAAPHCPYRLTEATTPHGDLLGWCATRVDTRSRCPITYLLDLAVFSPPAIAPLLHHIIATAAADSHAVAAVVSSAALAQLLAANGFWRVPSWAPLKRFYSVAKFNPHLPLAAPDWHGIHGWYQTLADWDNL